MSDGSTRPAKIEGINGDLPVPWQRNEEISSVQPMQLRIITGFDSLVIRPDVTHSSNRNGATTHAEQVSMLPVWRSSVVAPITAFGKRAFNPVRQWEGVVERVNGDSFVGRVVTRSDGYNAAETDANGVEFIEFSFDELNSTSDATLVQPGAVFYWTVGRAMNAAGTITNTSLVRFRRLPPVTHHQIKLAELEADELLSKLVPTDQSESTTY